MNTRIFRAQAPAWFLAIAMFLSGCDSVLPQRLHNMQFVQNRDFKEDEATVYNASEAALESMDYALVRGSRAGGNLEMAARVQPGSALRARQRRAVIEIMPLEGGGCSLRIAFWESSEDQSASGTVTANNQLLRSGTIYDVFWDHLTGKLSEAGAPPAADDQPKS